MKQEMENLAEIPPWFLSMGHFFLQEKMDDANDEMVLAVSKSPLLHYEVSSGPCL